MEYLVNKYGPQLAPPKSDEDLSIKYTYWLHFAEGSAMTPVLLALLFSMTEKGAPFFIRPIARAISGGVHKFYSEFCNSHQRVLLEIGACLLMQVPNSKTLLLAPQDCDDLADKALLCHSKSIGLLGLEGGLINTSCA